MYTLNWTPSHGKMHSRSHFLGVVKSLGWTWLEKFERRKKEKWHIKNVQNCNLYLKSKPAPEAMRQWRYLVWNSGFIFIFLSYFTVKWHKYFTQNAETLLNEAHCSQNQFDCTEDGHLFLHVFSFFFNNTQRVKYFGECFLLCADTQVYSLVTLKADVSGCRSPSYLSLTLFLKKCISCVISENKYSRFLRSFTF